MNNDKQIINAATLSLFCNTNEARLRKPVRGFILEFPGLGGGSCMGGGMDFAEYGHGYAEMLAGEGILVAYTFPGPWSWMNRGAVRYCELVADAIREKYQLPAETPWVVTGGSMGGMGALIYAAEAKIKPTACVSVCPCVDVPACFETHEIFRRTLFRAVADYEGEIADNLLKISPKHRIHDMPRIPYLLINDCADELFPEWHMDTYVDELRALGHSVEYDRLQDCGHGVITPEAWEHILGFFRKHLGLTGDCL